MELGYLYTQSDGYYQLLGNSTNWMWFLLPNGSFYDLLNWTYCSVLYTVNVFVFYAINIHIFLYYLLFQNCIGPIKLFLHVNQ